VDALSNDGLLTFASECGVSERLCTISDQELARKIVAKEGRREVLRVELDMLPDSLLEMRAAGVHTGLGGSQGNQPESDKAWELLTAGTVYVSGIAGRLEDERELQRTLAAAFGEVLVAKIRVRQRPQKSWGLCTFADAMSHDVALNSSDWPPAVSALVAENGFAFDRVDHHKARASTGAFGDIWRQTRTAVSDAQSQKLRKQAWRTAAIDALVESEPDLVVVKSVQAEVDVAVCQALLQHLQSANVTGGRVSRATRGGLLELALQHPSARSKLTDETGRRQRALRKELRFYSFSELVDKARTVDGPLMDQLNECGTQGLVYEDVLQMLWHGLLKLELIASVQRLEADMRHSALLRVARACGLDNSELMVPREQIRSLILASRLDSLAEPSVATDVLLPCSVAVATSLGGKVPNNVDFCTTIQDILDENPDAVKANVEGADGDLASADVHPTYDAMLNLLTDPYLTHFVVPQLEAWLRLHTTLDLSRSGEVPFCDLQCGLETACAPDIDVVQTSVMVAELLTSTKFVIRQRQLLQDVASIVVDDSAAMAAEDRLCIISQLKNRFPEATYHCQEILQNEFTQFTMSADRVSHSIRCRFNLPSLDSFIYELWKAAHRLVNAISAETRGDSLVLRKNPELRKQVNAFKSVIQHEIMTRCSHAMNSHVEIFGMGGRGQYEPEQTRIVKKYVAAYLLRRRMKLLSRVSNWMHSDDKLVKLQGRMRGVIERRRLNKAYQNSVGLTNVVQDEKRVDMELDDQMRYFDWTQVLIDYLRVIPEEERARSVATYLNTKKELQEAILKAEEDDEDPPDPSNDGGAGVHFPAILLYSTTIQFRLQQLQETRNRWHELLLMLDKDGSGTLLPIDLRCSLMAFAEMGIITELEDQQPMDEDLDEKTEQLEYYVGDTKAKQAGVTGEKLGWDPSIEKFAKRQRYESKSVSVGEELTDYPIYLSEDQVILTGIHGVDLAGSSWALTVDFQFDVDDPDVFVGASKYSVLTTSYRNNAIVMRLCGTCPTPGIQLIFVPKEAFQNAATAVKKCAEYERAGRDMIYEEFPSGRGTFECTPFIPMQQLHWYRLELQGGPAFDGPSQAGSDHQLTLLRIRVDPIDHDTREIIAQPETAPTYNSDGQYIPSGAMKQIWFDGRPPSGLVNKPRPKKRRRKKKDPPPPARVKPWMATEWLGKVDFRDIYAIGNVFDNNCCDASSELNWSIGPLCNLRVFAVQRTWLRSAVYQWPDSVGNNPQSTKNTIETPQVSDSDSSPSVRKPVEELPDLRFFLLQATESPDHTVFLGATSHGRVRKWAVRGLYQLTAELSETPREEIAFDASLYNPFNPSAWYYVEPSLECVVCDCMPWRYMFSLLRQALATGYNLPLYAEMKNTWQKDYEPGFPFSSSVINRNDINFIELKSNKTTELTRHFLRSIPSKEQRSYWDQPGDLRLDSSAMSLARAELVRDNPGLNSLLTGPQLRKTMKVMIRGRRLNKNKCKSVLRFWVWPFFYLQRLACYKTKPTSMYELGPAENVLLYVRRVTGKSPAGRILGGILLMWVMLAYALVGRLVLEQSVLHELEPLIAALYYVWAGALIAIEVADEVVRLPSNTPFKLAYMKAEISTMPITLTRIGNGQELQTTIMGFVQMVCRLHKSDEDDEEEEEEEEEEEADPFTISRKKLEAVWQQGDLQETLPFAEPGVLPSKVIFDYEIESHREVESIADWEDRNDVFMNSMKTGIDTGKPTPRAMKIITILALMNSLIGVIHRLVFLYDETAIIGPLFSEDRGGLVVLANMFVTFISSFIVYRSLFSLTFTWYMVLQFAEQMMKVLLIESAMQAHLPCYCDLRREGNLEGWFTGRRYFQTYCMTHIFGVKNQVKIASSLVVAGGFSLQAISNYFADAENIDWENPGGWFCLLNMFILLALLFLALVALERTNKATIKLVKKLDSVSIEVSRGVELEVQARLERDQERVMQVEQKREKERQRQAKVDEQEAMFHKAAGGAANEPGGANPMKNEVNDLKQRVCELEETLRETLVNTEDLVNRHDITQEARYLQVIIAQLANQPLLKIFGIVVDRAMLSNIFGGVIFLLYSVLKSSIDGILVKYLPPSPMKMALARANEAGGDVLDDLTDEILGSGSWSMP
jgi:hypothetical protein